MRLTYLKLGASAFFWGGSAIAGKLVMDELGPASTTFLRFGGAAVLLLAIVPLARLSLRVGLREHLQYATLGLIGVTLCYYFYFRGLQASSAFNAALLEATIPLVTLALGVAAGRERASRLETVGFFVSYLGVVVIITRLSPDAILEAEYNWGDILLLLSTVCFGLYNFLLKLFAPRVDATVQTCLIFCYGALGLVPWLVLDPDGIADLRRFPELEWDLIGCMAFMAIGSSVLAYLFFNQGVHLLGAAKASGFINLVPVITIVLSLALLGERPRPIQILGAAIVMLGVYLSQRRARSGPARAEVSRAEPDRRAARPAPTADSGT
ncbi:DMT family transporter [Streptomyces sp. 8K308]|uniref:DMT family transporter n=1 Tax=Streptomyces sp. 8K308 TaxID=2530388 RepID=UPI00104BA9DA|nr:DMT family transporter [Streptomyces sp. 8K308]TDC22368.1 DMT family transporter [Streptomyces sp. 8K308]